MSLHHLGIAHFPVLHRQFSSPTSRAFLESSPSEDLTQDSKDVLVERLNDLVLRLSKANALEESAISSIHKEVDKIEKMVRVGEKTKKIGDEFGALLPSAMSSKDDEIFWAPSTPTQNMKMRFPGQFARSPQSFVRSESRLSSTQAAAVTHAAEELASNMSKTLVELLDRKQEADHIHDLLITRAEKAAERILVLEYRIAEMEDDFQANQSELKFLRIQLQAIEAQCSQYIPKDEDPELTESIMNWKVDWEDINKRSKARRKNCQVSVSHISDISTIVDG